MASQWIKELTFCTFSLVLAGATSATLLFPYSSAWTLVNWYSIYNSKRRSHAVTHAHLIIPVEIIWTCLFIASTFAFFCVPIIRVIQASLRNAFPSAELLVENLADMFFIRTLPVTNTLFAIPVSRIAVYIRAIINFYRHTMVHIPVETRSSLLPETATSTA